MSRPRKPAPTFTCEYCGRLTECSWQENNRRYHAAQRFCTVSCAQRFQGDLHRKKEIPTFFCKKCGRETQRTVQKAGFRKVKVNYAQTYCSKRCAQVGRVHGRVSQGFVHKKNGYRYIMIKGHIIGEHRIVMEQMIGRELLDTETVHHKNGIRTDNRPENLELWAKQHGPGSRVIDQVKWAREVLATYGKFDLNKPSSHQEGGILESRNPDTFCHPSFFNADLSFQALQ
jgi:hypothetical protein